MLTVTHEGQSSEPSGPGTGVVERGRSWRLTGGGRGGGAGGWGRGNSQLVCSRLQFDEEWIVMERSDWTEGVLM